jgi:N-acetylneuraminic acid mutarotase
VRTETLIWSQVSCHAKHPKDQPGPRAFHTATLLDNNRILVFGGTDGHSCVSHVHVLNTDAHEWKRVKPYNARTVWPRLGHTATLVGRMLFVFGGFDGCDYVNEVHMLDLGT